MKKLLLIILLLLLLNFTSCQYPDEVGELTPGIEGNDGVGNVVNLTLKISQSALVLDMCTCNLTGLLNSALIDDYEVEEQGFLYRKLGSNEDKKFLVAYCNNGNVNINAKLENLEPATQYEYCMFFKTREGLLFMGEMGYFETYSLDFSLMEYNFDSSYDKLVLFEGTFDSRALANDNFQMYLEVSSEEMVENIYYTKRRECLILSPGKFSAELTNLKRDIKYFARLSCVYKSSTYKSEIISFTLK